MKRKKHKILKALYDCFEEKEKEKFGESGPTELGQTLTVVELTNKTKLNADEIQAVAYTLTNAGHIELYQKDDVNKSHRYLITDSGRQAYIDKFYENQIWYRSKEFWFKFSPILIAAGTLIWTVSVNNNLRKKLNDQEIKIINLQNLIYKNKSK